VGLYLFWKIGRDDGILGDVSYIVSRIGGSKGDI